MVRIRASVMVLVATLALTVGIAPALAKGKHDQGKPGKGDGVSATHSLRAPVTDQNFYFVMADRFQDGDDANDNGGLPPGTTRASPASTRPTRAGTTAATSPACWTRSTTSRGSGPPPSGSRRASRTRRSRTTRASRPPATTATGSPTSRRSTRTSGPTTICATSSRPPTRAASRSTSTSSPTTRPTSSVPGRRRAAVHLEGPLSLPGRRGHRVRRSRLRGRQHVPRLSPSGQPSCPGTHARGASPTARASRRRAGLQGPGLAQRRQPLPQPRQHDVRR